jgi:dTDP-4-amino-4,6-dideoxygalactose transaminase
MNPLERIPRVRRLPSFTFLATLSVIVLAGMTPVFCDIEPDTWTR